MKREASVTGAIGHAILLRSHADNGGGANLFEVGIVPFSARTEECFGGVGCGSCDDEIRYTLPVIIPTTRPPGFS